MMNLKELRIGNFVIIDGEYIGKVTSVAAEGINGVRDGDFDMAYDMAEPIPLTEEWLEKMGFIRGRENGNRNVFYGSGAHSAIHSVSLSGGVMIHRAGNTLLLERHVDFVHQLQNLYFALTGNELQITK